MVKNEVSANPKVSKSRVKLDAMAGALAGAVSRLVVGPLDVVKIRMQVQLEPVAVGAPSKYTGVWQALRQILADEGVKVHIQCLLQ
jgi:solute carrier family 25 (mitochondrial thiamine pyrophosphate transporter), member 19